jgi:adenine-specific DNA-methyltransferase
MYPRLKLARNLLRDDGVIFISIDDHEVHNLRKVCDEIFGEMNFVADLIWTNKEGGGSSDSKYFRIKHEHILVYSRMLENIEIIGDNIGNEDRYKEQDKHLQTRGKYYLQKLGMGSIHYSSSLDYAIVAPDETEIMPKDNNKGQKACWRWSKAKFEWGIENDYIVIKKDRDEIWTVYTKQYLNADNEGNIIDRTQRPFGVIDTFSSTQGAKLLRVLGFENIFNFSKPVDLIRYLIEKIDLSNNIILDFFSGSATTAHAVMQLNGENNGNRKYIMVQLPEQTDENSEAYKAGYKNICEIGKERIRRAANKVKEEKRAKAEKDGMFADFEDTQDYGFRVYRLDSSNMQDVYYRPQDYKQEILDLFADNIKPDRSADDLLAQVMLDWGLPLSYKIERETILGKQVFKVAQDSLFACFDTGIDETFAKEIAKEKPLRVVFRDSGFANDTAKINVQQLLKQLSPETEMKVM